MDRVALAFVLTWRASQARLNWTSTKPGDSVSSDKELPDAADLLEKIRTLLEAKKYRVRLHAVRHMVEEGFRESDILTAVLERCKILEDYRDESRCLLLGYFPMSENASSPLHVVCDYSNDEVVDIVTAYIPQKPWWETPSRRGR